MDASWHLPSIGAVVPKIGQTSPSLRFVRHANSTVRLHGRLPSLLVTATRANLLSAINPKNGSIAWRFILPDRDPILTHAINLDHRSVAVVSGADEGTVRLLNLSDGRVVWEKSLGRRLADHSLESLDGTDVLFTHDNSSEHEEFPDLVVTCGGKRVLRLSGLQGDIIWQWIPESSLGRIIRLLPQTHGDQISVVLWSDADANIRNTRVQTLSSISGLAGERRPQSTQLCHHTPGGPLILQADGPPQSSFPRQVVVCADGQGVLSSALVPDNPLEPLVVSSYMPSGRKHPILEDVGLGHRGIFVAKFVHDPPNVLRVKPDGTLTSVWTFDEADPTATFAGSVDRHGLPYVSKVTYADNLGLGSLETLSLTPTEHTPEGMVVGQTFMFDRPENGRIFSIAVEVLQMTNYVPMSRVVVATDMGTIQLWQGEVLQWERHEDLASSAAISLYQPKSMSGSLSHIVPANLPQYAVQLAKRYVKTLLNLSRRGDGVITHYLDANIWLVGTNAGRLFAIGRADDGLGKVLWKRNLLASAAPQVGAKWISLAPEGTQPPRTARISASFQQEDRTTLLVRVALVDGKILESTIQPPLEPGEKPLRSGHKKILASHDRDLGGSPARFLGDRGALFKYHNPDLLVYFSVDDGHQIVEIVDRISGALVWAFQLQNPVDPDSVVATLTDNWLVLASRDSSTGLSRTHSIEWYMSSRSDVRVDGSPINITSCVRAYITPFEIKSVGLTQSRLGVTSRALLVITDMDQIISIPRRLLDCRRPLLKPTKAEIEERLIPYDPVILADPKSILTGDRDTAKLVNIYSFPTEFESTSAVIGVGLDLFATSIAPSRPFDMLGPQFNKLQLILTTAALLMATLVLKPLVKNKQLKQQWYS